MKNNLLKGLLAVFISFVLVSVALPLAIYYTSIVLFPYQAKGEPLYFNGELIGYEYVYVNLSIRGFFNSTNPSYMSPIITEQAAMGQAKALNVSVGVPLSFLTELIKKYSYRDVLTGRYLVNVNLLNLNLLKYYYENKSFESYFLKGMERIQYLNQTVFNNLG